MAHHFRILDRSTDPKVTLYDDGRIVTLNLGLGNRGLGARKLDPATVATLREMGFDVRSARTAAQKHRDHWDSLPAQNRLVLAIREAHHYYRWTTTQQHRAIVTCAEALWRPPSDRPTTWREDPEHLLCELDKANHRRDEAGDEYFDLVRLGWLILDYTEMDALLDQLRQSVPPTEKV